MTDIKAQLRKEIEDNKIEYHKFYKEKHRQKINLLKATLSGIEQGEKIERERILNILYGFKMFLDQMPCDKNYMPQFAKGTLISQFEGFLEMIDKQEAGEKWN